MRILRKAWLAVAVATAAALTLAACSSSKSSPSSSSSAGASSSSSSASNQKSGGTLKVLGGTSPDSLDPGFGYTTQALEADNMVYTPLLTYAAQGRRRPARCCIPGLAQALPTVSADGLTYTLTLRSGLTYSDGTPVKASDFTHAIERSIKISWGGASFFTGYIDGRRRLRQGQGHGISGIVTDDATGTITITLTQAYGAFDNLLAFPAAAPMPATTPMTVLSNTPPVGIGPYKFGNDRPERRRTRWSRTRRSPASRSRASRPASPTRSTSTSTATPRPRPSRCSTTRPTSSTRVTRSRRPSLADVQLAGQGPVPEDAARLGLLLLPEHPGRAVQQRGRPARPSTWRSTGRRWPGCPAVR